MKEGLWYLETGSVDPYFNLALEEYVLREKTHGNWLILWQNHNTIVIGQNQNAEEEINWSYVQENEIHVVRRMSGGGAVYHDLGNLNYSFISDAGDAEKMTLEHFAIPVAEALRKLGLNAEVSGRNDIVVEGRKVSGAAQRLHGGRILHHGTLLFDSDLSKVEASLRVNSLKYQSRSAKSVRSRTGCIRDFLPQDMTMDAFKEYLKAELSDGAIQGELTDSELTQIRKLAEEKYASWNWNFGKSRPCTARNAKKWPGGVLEIKVQMENGRIEYIDFAGDFLSRVSIQQLQEALFGVPWNPEAIKEILTQFALDEYFGSISAEEILKTMFE